MTSKPVRTLLHVFPGFGLGGAQMRFAGVANHLGPTYRHFVVAMNGATEAVRLLAPQLKVELLSIPVQAGNRGHQFIFRCDPCGNILLTILDKSSHRSFLYKIDIFTKLACL